MKSLWLSLMLLVAGGCLSAQTLNGNATATSADCFEVNMNVAWQVGSVYFPDTLNLNRPFNFRLSFEFGSNDANGADGMVFVLQNNTPNELGPAGGSLGWFGIPNSLGIEFDTYQNPVNDPAYDHISIFRDGEIDHALPNHLIGPVPAIPGNGNIEDGQPHLVEVTWDPAIQELEVYFDCTQRLTLPIDLVTDIFSGDSLVYWGVSAAGGGAFNRHSFCNLANQTPNTSSDTLTICLGDTASLIPPPARDNYYEYSPNYNQSGGNGPSLSVWPAVDTAYVVNYLDPCGNPWADTILILVQGNLPITLGNDTTICSSSSYELGLALPNGTFVWSDGSTDSTLLVNTAGLYEVLAIDENGCQYLDSQNVDFGSLPTVDAGPDTSVCDASLGVVLTALNPQANSTYYWSTGDTATSIEVDEIGNYVLFAENACGTLDDEIEVSSYRYEEGYFVPNVFTPNGDGFNDEYLVEKYWEEGFELRIFDRWGRQVFLSTDQSEGWNGTENGSNRQAGVYFYTLRVLDCQGESQMEHGTLSLVR